MQINNKKWNKVTLKLTKNKLNIGPICIDMRKILKVKIFPTEISEENNKNKDSFQFSITCEENLRMLRKNILKITI